MKNIHVLPTDKPSRLHLYTDENGTRPALCELEYSHTRNAQNIYITSDEEIKRIDYWLNIDNNTISNGEMFELANDAPSCKKIILTTDQDLIKDGVQAVDDDFLEWFVKNPSCDNCFYGRTELAEQLIWQQERMYSEEEFLEFSQWISHNDWVYLPSKVYWVNEEQEELDQKFTTKELFEQFKKK